MEKEKKIRFFPSKNDVFTSIDDQEITGQSPDDGLKGTPLVQCLVSGSPDDGLRCGLVTSPSPWVAACPQAGAAGTATVELQHLPRSQQRSRGLTI
jgi:hypothetical protein